MRYSAVKAQFRARDAPIGAHWRRGTDCSRLRRSSLRDHRRFAPVSFAAATRRLVEPACLYRGFESPLRDPPDSGKYRLTNLTQLAEREG